MTAQKEIGELRDRIANLEKIVVLGDGARLPLAEMVRNVTNTVGNLTNTVSDYIAQKDKEEQHAAEAKRTEWNRLKWLVIPMAISGFGIFAGQALVFYFRIVPLLDKVVP